MRVCQNSVLPACRDIFLYLSVYSILIFSGCLADKYKNMSLQAGWKHFIYWHILTRCGILCKDNANRMQSSLLEIAEAPLILCKDNANRTQYKIKRLFLSAVAFFFIRSFCGAFTGGYTSSPFPAYGILHSKRWHIGTQKGTFRSLKCRLLEDKRYHLDFQ